MNDEQIAWGVFKEVINLKQNFLLNIEVSLMENPMVSIASLTSANEVPYFMQDYLVKICYMIKGFNTKR